MKFPFFASFLVFCAIFYIRNRAADRKRESIKQAYFDRETKANSVRKQSLDNLDYISIPLDRLPVNVCSEDPQIAEYLSDLKTLAEEKIVNFTGLTNTDLKLAYGPANLPFLQKCDLSYTHLVRVLQDWAKRLYDLDCHDEALTVLLFSLECKTDISAAYYLTADIYTEKNTPEKIKDLIEIAGSINSLMKNSIIENLKERIGESQSAD